MSSEFSEYDGPGTSAREEVLDVLGDDCSRTILATASARPVSAKELIKQCDVSSATVYRRVNSLLEQDLLREEVSFTSGGKQNTVYETTFEHLDVYLDESGFEVQRHDSHDLAVELARLLATVPGDRREVDLGDGEVRLRLDLNEDLRERFIDVWDRV